MTNLPVIDCPNFDSCSVNNCPLHPGYPDLLTCIDDPEIKCKAQKPTRIKIAEKYPGVLRFDGLSLKEHRLKIKRENRTPEEWAKLRLRAKKLLQGRDSSIQKEKVGVK